MQLQTRGTKDADNHIVLVDPKFKRPILKTNEAHLVTAEFTPRVRLDHPKLYSGKVAIFDNPTWKSPQKPQKGKLLVRVTGRLMIRNIIVARFSSSGRTTGKFILFSKWNTARRGKKCTEASDEKRGRF